MFGLWSREQSDAGGGLLGGAGRSRGGGERSGRPRSRSTVTASKCVRVLVLGDSGVGKSTMVHVLCHKSVDHSKPYTVGCTVDALLHPSRTAGECFVELVDVGAAAAYASARRVFYQEPYHGVILVHDLTNKRSNANLGQWVAELLGTSKYSWEEAPSTPSSTSASNHRLVLRSSAAKVPVLFVGNKKDVAWCDPSSAPNAAIPSIANDQVLVSSYDSGAFARGTLEGDKVYSFIEHVVRERYSSSGPGASAAAPFGSSAGVATDSATVFGGSPAGATLPTSASSSAVSAASRATHRSPMPQAHSSLDARSGPWGSPLSPAGSSRRPTSNLFPFSSPLSSTQRPKAQ